MMDNMDETISHLIGKEVHFYLENSIYGSVEVDGTVISRAGDFLYLKDVRFIQMGERDPVLFMKYYLDSYNVAGFWID